MNRRRAWLLLAGASLVLATVHPAVTQTPDGETPAEEEACEKYAGQGARYGLCVAYCEAQDCDDQKRGDESCVNLAQNFIDWSVKKGYIKKPKFDETINCRRTHCSANDRLLCRGEERDCDIDGQCTAICTSTFVGYLGGNPLCKGTKCPDCVADIPKIH